MCKSTKYILVIATAMCVGIGTGAVAQTDVDTLFELEGDFADNNPPGPPNADWESCNCPSAPFACNAAFHTGVDHDATGATVYTIGSTKDDLDLNGWHWKHGQVPDKDDLLNAYAALHTVGAERLLYVGGDRFDNEGSAFIGAWFYQDPVALRGDGSKAGDFVNPTPCALAPHQHNDMLIPAEFPGGARIAQVKVFRWVGTNPAACVAPGVLDNESTLCDITGLGSFTVTHNGANNVDQISIPGTCTA